MPELHTREQDRAFRASQTIFIDPNNTKKKRFLQTLFANNKDTPYDRKSIEAKNNFLVELLESPSSSAFFRNSISTNAFGSSDLSITTPKEQGGEQKMSSSKKKVDAEALFGAPTSPRRANKNPSFALPQSKRDSQRDLMSFCLGDSITKTPITETNAARAEFLEKRHALQRERLLNTTPSARAVMWNVVAVPKEQGNFFHQQKAKSQKRSALATTSEYNGGNKEYSSSSSSDDEEKHVKPQPPKRGTGRKQRTVLRRGTCNPADHTPPPQSKNKPALQKMMSRRGTASHVTLSGATAMSTVPVQAAMNVVQVNSANSGGRNNLKKKSRR